MNPAETQKLVIYDTAVPVDSEGRISLNVLHKASSENASKRPSNWMRLDSTKELVRELSSDPSLGEVVSVQKGGSTPGTFAHELLAVSYAGWINAKFQLQVNQVFLEYKQRGQQQSLQFSSRYMVEMQNGQLGALKPIPDDWFLMSIESLPGFINDRMFVSEQDLIAIGQVCMNRLSKMVKV